MDNLIVYVVFLAYLSLFIVVNLVNSYKYKYDRYYTDNYHELNTGHILRRNNVVAEVLDVKTRIEKSNIMPYIYEDIVLLVKGEKFIVRNETFFESDLLYTNNYVKGDSVVVTLTDLKCLHKNAEKTIVTLENKVARYVKKPFWKKSWV